MTSARTISINFYFYKVLKCDLKFIAYTHIQYISVRFDDHRCFSPLQSHCSQNENLKLL